MFGEAITGTAHVSFGLITVLALGFVLGMRHATDADHVVAISTIVTRERRMGSAAAIGLLWGVGHTITIIAVGVGIIAFTLVIPPRLGLSMEFSVGMMLVLLGAINLRGMTSAWSGAQTSAGAEGVVVAPKVSKMPHGMVAHEHSDETVEHSMRNIDGWFGGRRIYDWARPFVVGLVHGLAGSAAIALLVLATLHNSAWALAYLLVFGVGTIAGMMVITVAMASALRFAGARSKWINRRLSIAAGFLSVAFGLFIVYQMGFVHGLFTAHPTWIPQ